MAGNAWNWTHGSYLPVFSTVQGGTWDYYTLGLASWRVEYHNPIYSNGGRVGFRSARTLD